MRTTLAQQRIEKNARLFGWLTPSPSTIATIAECLANDRFEGRSKDWQIGALQQALKNLAGDVRKLDRKAGA